MAPRKPRIGRPPRKDRSAVGRPVRAYLLPAQIAALRALGNGNFSAGIVKALEYANVVTAPSRHT